MCIVAPMQRSLVGLAEALDSTKFQYEKTVRFAAGVSRLCSVKTRQSEYCSIASMHDESNQMKQQYFQQHLIQSDSKSDTLIKEGLQAPATPGPRIHDL